MKFTAIYSITFLYVLHLKKQLLIASATENIYDSLNNQDSIHKYLSIDNVVRNIDLSERIATVSVTTTLKNTHPSNVCESFFIAIPSDIGRLIGSIYIKTQKNKLLNVKRVYSSNQSAFQDLFLYESIGLSIPPSSSIKYILAYTLGHQYRPLPLKIGLTDTQKVVFEDYSFAVSPYPVAKQQTIYHIPPKSLEHQKGLTVINGDSLKVTVNHKSSFERETQKTIYIHFALKRHLGYFPKVERRVEVSHWGDIFIHEFYTFKNEAAKLDGEYDRWAVAQMIGSIVGRRRVPGMKFPNNHICFELEAQLPSNVYGIEFYDEIGNISSSSAWRKSGLTALKLEPRYPILGDWKGDWHLYYSLPKKFALQKFKSSDLHVLNIGLGPPIQSVYADRLEVRVVLPFGAHKVQINPPRDFVTHDGTPSVSIDQHYGWLGFLSPRQVVVIQLDGFAVDNSLQNHNLVVTYNYIASMSDFRKPFLCCVMAFIPFLIYIFISKLDFRIFTKALDISFATDPLRGQRFRGLVFDVIRTNEELWDKIGLAKSDRMIATAKVDWRDNVMRLSRDISQVVSDTRNSIICSEEVKEHTYELAMKADATIRLLDEITSDAKSQGWTAPVEAVKHWKKENAVLVQILKVMNETKTK